MSGTAPTRSAGRPASASRDEVLALALAQYRASSRIDITGIASFLGLSRATVHRWYGSREGLITSVLIREFDQAFDRACREATGSGAPRVLSTMQVLQENVRKDRNLQSYLRREGSAGLRILTTDGPFQRHVVSAVQSLIEESAASGEYTPPLDAETLAYALVRLAEAFIYHDTAVGARSDLDRLSDVERILLGLGG